MDTVLLVDDDRALLNSLNCGLRAHGYQVVDACNGLAALAQLDQASPAVDLVVTDYAMPGMNGLDLLKIIKARHCCLPVVLMTAFGDMDVVCDALRSKCDGYLEKPFAIEKLVSELQRIKQCCGRHDSCHSVLANISKLIHQTNNSLMAIVGHADLAQCHAVDRQPVTLHLEAIRNAVGNVQLINRKIISLGRSDVEEATRLVSLGDVVDQAVASFVALLELKKISLHLECHVRNSVVRVYGDGLVQLFRNLIMNAIDSMEGSPTRALSINSTIVPSNGCGSVTVQDTGCGIEPGLIGRIFQPYFSTKPNGNGLGLAVVNDLLRKHAGTITVDSSPGRGTVFTISLPLVAVENGGAKRCAG